MQSRIAAIGKEQEIGGVLRCLREGVHHYGAIGHTYFFTPIFSKQASANAVVEIGGFSPQLVALYQDSSFRVHDPIPDHIIERGVAMRWSQAVEETLAKTQDRETRKFFAMMEQMGAVNGMGIPLYGPRNRNAYGSFGFAEPLTDADDERCAALGAIMQAAHIRICELDDRTEASITLSAREHEVLQWISQGKSNTDIGTILDISPDTVATYVKRVFDKFGTRDRVGVTIKALKLGLIRL